MTTHAQAPAEELLARGGDNTRGLYAYDPALWWELHARRQADDMALVARENQRLRERVRELEDALAREREAATRAQGAPMYINAYTGDGPDDHSADSFMNTVLRM